METIDIKIAWSCINCGAFNNEIVTLTIGSYSRTTKCKECEIKHALIHAISNDK